MLTHMLLSYKLSRWKLVVLYLAIIPLLAFALYELVLYAPKRGGWEYWFHGVIVVSALMGAVHLYRKWARVVTEMHCTEAGIHVQTAMCGNYDISWNRIQKFRDLGGTMSGLSALEPADELPVFLYLDQGTHDKFVALLRKLSTTASEVSEADL